MVRMRITGRNSLLFRFITLSFLLILVIALALDGRLTHCDLGDVSHSLRLTRDQPTWQVTIQKNNSRATVSGQNPLPLKAIS